VVASSLNEKGIMETNISWTAYYNSQDLLG